MAIGSKQECAGVICLHCGMHTPLPDVLSRAGNEKVMPADYPQITIVRCLACGKEAPYLADEIVIAAARRVPACFSA